MSKKPEKRPMGRPPLRKVRLQLKMRVEVREALAQAAQEQNMTMSDCVEEALTQWFKRRGK
jgi:predicted HicB family RNase H-like nuclease